MEGREEKEQSGRGIEGVKEGTEQGGEKGRV